MKNLQLLFCSFIFLLLAHQARPQDRQKDDLSPQELADYKSRVEQLVSFLEFTLNTLGSEQTPTKEKEIIINESFQKIFMDETVQIEDDLDENREVVTNKDVQAYLQDIDFFFEDVSIEFMVEDIQHYVNDQDQIYFLVSLNRNLNGVTINNDTVNSVKPRYIEINLKEAASELKIASIYTTKLSEKEELTNWWNNLPFEWQSIFKRQIGVYDTIDVGQLKEIIALEQLDISENKFVTNLNGIGKLRNLQELDISRTKVDNLIPIRNNTSLRVLNASNTQIESLEPLKYTANLEQLIFHHTPLTDIENLQKYPKLHTLNLAHTNIYDISVISQLQQLKQLNLNNSSIYSLDVLSNLTEIKSLNISNTFITDLSPINSLKNLEFLNFSNTKVRDMAPLVPLQKLSVIVCNNTPVSDLDPLNQLASLQRIYCDGTLVTKIQASQFMKQHPEILVVFKSEVLQNWWRDLPESWQSVFRQQVSLDSLPGKEQLAQVAQITSLDISGISGITSLQPLTVLENLRKLDCSGTGIPDLEPLRELEDLEYLNTAQTSISDLEPISFLKELKILDIEKTQVSNLLPIFYHNELRYLYCDNIPAEEAKINAFIYQNKDCLVIYKTKKLTTWWNSLSSDWRDVFKKHLSALVSSSSFEKENNGLNLLPSKEDLHKIANLRIISIQNNYNIASLQPLAVLDKLKSLHFSNTRINDLSPIAELISLESLNCSENPIMTLEPISGLTDLRHLDFSNTPVEDLDPIEELSKLEELNCAGTMVKDLDALEEIYQLKFLNISNTQVRNLKDVDNHHLRRLICFNTRISTNRIRNYQKDHPDTIIKYY